MRTLRDLYTGPQARIVRQGCFYDKSSWLPEDSCRCEGKRVPCSDLRKDAEIIVLPHTARVLQKVDMPVLDIPGPRAPLTIGAD